MGLLRPWIPRAAEAQIVVPRHLDVAALERARVAEARPARRAVARERARIRRPLEHRADPADLPAERERAPGLAPLGEARQPLPRARAVAGRVLVGDAVDRVVVEARARVGAVRGLLVVRLRGEGGAGP